MLTEGLTPECLNRLVILVLTFPSSGQTPIQAEIMLKRYLDQLNPQVVIIEVNPYAFTSDGVESALDLIANDANDWLSIEMTFRLNHLKVYNTLIYGMFDDWFQRNADFKEPIVKEKRNLCAWWFYHKAD